jgi:hypothetical protein
MIVRDRCLDRYRAHPRSAASMVRPRCVAAGGTIPPRQSPNKGRPPCPSTRPRVHGRSATPDLPFRRSPTGPGLHGRYRIWPRRWGPKVTGGKPGPAASGKPELTSAPQHQQRLPVCPSKGRPLLASPTPWHGDTREPPLAKASQDTSCGSGHPYLMRTPGTSRPWDIPRAQCHKSRNVP